MLEKCENRSPYTVLAYSIPTAEELSQKLKDAGLNPDGILQFDKLPDGTTHHQAEDRLHEVIEPYIGKKPKWGEDGYDIMKSIAHDAREAHLKFVTFFVAKWKGKIRELEVNFCGCGDSGDLEVESIYDVDDKKVVRKYPDWITTEKDKAEYRIDIEVEEEIIEDFEKWGHSFVNNCVIDFDWYNNDGGQGLVRINLDTGDCTMEGSQTVPKERDCNGSA
jgi:hypothetical protein